MRIPPVGILGILGIALFPMLSALGCGAELSEADARQLWRNVEDSLVDGSGNNGGGGFGQALTVSTSVDSEFDAECDEGGTVSFDGTVSTSTTVGDGVSSASVFDYAATYDNCADDDNTINGTVDWTSAVNVVVDDGAEVIVVYSYEGTVVVSGEENGTCDFDLEGSVLVSAGASGVFVGVSQRDETDYEGTLCGHDADDVLNVDVAVVVDDD